MNTKSVKELKEIARSLGISLGRRIGRVAEATSWTIRRSVLRQTNAVGEVTVAELRFGILTPSRPLIPNQ